MLCGTTRVSRDFSHTYLHAQPPDNLLTYHNAPNLIAKTLVATDSKKPKKKKKKRAHANAIT